MAWIFLPFHIIQHLCPKKFLKISHTATATKFWDRPLRISPTAYSMLEFLLSVAIKRLWNILLNSSSDCELTISKSSPSHLWSYPTWTSPLHTMQDKSNPSLLSNLLHDWKVIIHSWPSSVSQANGLSSSLYDLGLIPSTMWVALTVCFPSLSGYMGMECNNLHRLIRSE